jgi:hypothetical protein
LVDLIQVPPPPPPLPPPPLPPPPFPSLVHMPWCRTTSPRSW